MLSGTTALSANELSANDLRLARVQPTIIGEIPSDTDGMYIVRLSDPSIATYDGGIAGYRATSAQANGDRRLNTKSKAAKKYEKYLRDQQKELLGNAGKAFGRDLDTKYDYQHAINGFAIELTVEEAKEMRGMLGVASVQRERMEQPLTDVGPAWIGAPTIWGGSEPNEGEGLVVAVLDTGVNSDHPSFADVGDDGYDHTNPLGSGSYIPGSYCDVTDPSFCNDKLIGAWDMVQTAADPTSPEDSNGHGSHTASTAAGNVVLGAELVAPTTSALFDISGVARHANIIMYDVCVASCPGSALVMAINQVLVDAGNLPNGIAALNYSISGGGSPYNDTVELGFLAAVAAGVYVSASAGNSGPTPSTVAHLGPWVSTTAASTHNRAIVNSLISMTSDGPSLLDISGVSFSAGYGAPTSIIHANTTAFDPTGQCLLPFPGGTFSSEIVVCDRGTIARVAKGANVLAGGAGGFVLANLDAQGEGIVADAHFLPAIHIGDIGGDALRAWLAGNTGTVATITPFAFDLSASNGDIMAGFSSRGPQTAFDVLKPDVTAPGVNIMAAEADGGNAGMAPEYQVISGTSMSSPHNAGAGALVTGVQPTWSPQAIKSAIMMTADTADMLKEDGATPADAFDHGAGRVDLTEAGDAGLVLNESIGNFLAADPGLGGDPSSLNVASMMNSNCVGTCKWKRTVTGVNSGNKKFDLSTSGPAGLGLTTNPTPQIVVGKNKTKSITVNADTTFATPGWNFANLHIDPQGSGPDLHMPIAVFASDTTDGNVLNKSVDMTSGVEAGDTLTYEINITNGQLAGEIELEDVIPAGTTFVASSESEVVTGGITTSPFGLNGGAMTWTGELDVAGMAIAPTVNIGGYLPMAMFSSPIPNPGGCDEGGYLISGMDIFYNGQHYTTGILSVNGTLELGTASGSTTGFINDFMPDPSGPDNLLAPFWGDMNLCTGGAWYLVTLTDGFGTFWDIFEWEAVPEWPAVGANTFQIWLEIGTSTITFAYGPTSAFFATVGAENIDGTVGDTWYFNGGGTPVALDDELGVFGTPGGTATFEFEVTVDECADPGIANEARISNHGDKERAIATSTCD